MQASTGIPALIPIPFASSGAKNTIPMSSQIAITPGAASYTDGFPPLTRTNPLAGGIAPSGQDFNGILNAITNAILWNQAGGGYYYDSTFGPAISGYPVGAKLNASDNSGHWLNLTDANAVSPESTTTPTGWVPGYQYGVTAITGLAATSITLTPLQAAKRRITLAGTLTANINIIFPTWLKDWIVVNGCTGAFTVTCKTAAGNGITIASGKTAAIGCDGVNIFQDAIASVLQSGNNLSDVGSVPAALANLGLSNSDGSVGRLIGPPVMFLSSGTYYPTPGTKKIIVEVWAAGGGGGGAAATGASTVAVGNSGGGGSYSKGFILSPIATAITIGAGGAAGTSAPGNGGQGGTSSFGSLIVCAGGNGGFAGTAQAAGFVIGTTSGGLVTTSGNLLNIGGGLATQGFTISSTGLIASLPGGAMGVPVGPTSVGCGGYGAWSKASYAASAGALGQNGLVIIWEYA